MTTVSISPSLQKYAIAVLAVLVTVGVRFALSPVLGQTVPFITLFPGVVFAAWYGGSRTGYAATALGAALALLLFVEPVGSLVPTTPRDAIPVALFVGLGGFISFLVGRGEEARSQLAEERGKLAVTLASIGDAVVTTDAGRRVTFLNPEAERLTGWPRVEAIGRDLDDVFPVVNQNTRERVPCPVTKVIETGRVVGLANHTVLVARDGTERPIDDAAAPIRDEAGTLYGVVLVFRDISDKYDAARRLQAAHDELERRVAERTEELRREKAFLVAVLENTEDGIVACDGAGVLTLFNRATRAFHGLPPEPLPPDEWARSYDIYGPDGSTPLAKAEVPLFRALSGEHVRDAEMVIAPKGGEPRTLLASGQPLFDGAGHKLGAVVSMHDVTDRRRAEAAHAEVARVEALRRSEARFREFADTAPAMLWATEPDASCSFLSQGWYDFTGQTEKEGLGFGWLDAVHPDDRDAAGRAFLAANERGKPFALEHRVRRADGEYCWVIDAGRPRFSAEGEFLGYVGSVTDITDRRAAEETLRSSEEQFRAIATQTSVGIAQTDLTGRFVYANARYCDLLGYRVDELLGRTMQSLTHPDDLATNLPLFGEAVRTGTSFSIEKRYVRKDGSPVWVSNSVSVVRDADGRAVRVQAVTVDVSERKRAEEALRSSKELYWRTLESLTDGFVVQDRDFRFTYVNAAAERLNGVSRHELLGKTQWEAYPACVGTILEREFRRAMGERVTVEFENHYQPWDRWFALKVDPADDGGLCILYRDVTTAKRAEQTRDRLLAREQLRATLLTKVAVASRQLNASLSVDGVSRVLVDEARAILGTHVAVASLAGQNERDQWVRAASLSDKYGEYRGRPIHPDGLSAHVCRTNAPLRLSEANVRSHPEWDGTGGGEAAPLPTRGWLGVPLVGHGGKNLGLIQLSDKEEGDFNDEDEAILTQLAAIAATGIENARLYGSLREQDKRKDEFLATLAHELRNPLAPLRNGLTVFRMGKTQEGGGKTIDMMERQLGQLVHLVDDLLDVSRVTSGKINLRTERMQLREVVEAAVETSRPGVEAARHRFETRLPGEPLPLDGDKTRLAQVLVNLLNNAVKYTPDGGTIVLSAERDGADVLIRVTDTGVGLPGDMLPKVFEVFTQVGRSIERSQGGLGLGLALVKKIVEMHGGTTWAESPGPGRGSTFVVRLPLASGSATRNTEEVAAVGPPSGSPRRLLIVDDNVDSADSLAVLLGIAGHRTETAYTGPGAVEKAKAFKPDAVFLDIGLPGMNGYEVGAALRADPTTAGTVLVAVTGWGTDDDRQRATAAGFDHHLTKPAEIEKVFELLRRLPSNESRR